MKESLLAEAARLLYLFYTEQSSMAPWILRDTVVVSGILTVLAETPNASENAVYGKLWSGVCQRNLAPHDFQRCLTEARRTIDHLTVENLQLEEEAAIVLPAGARSSARTPVAA